MPDRHALDADPRVLWRHLRELKKDLLALGGTEIITPAGGEGPPRIRSVVQLDGDIVSEVDLTGTPEDTARAIDAHCAQLADYVRRTHRSMLWARHGVAGAITVAPPVLASVVWSTLLPVVALAGSAIVGVVATIVRRRRLLAAIVMVAAGAVTAFALVTSWLDGAREVLFFWGLGIVWALLAAVLGWVAGRIIRSRLGVL